MIKKLEKWSIKKYNHVIKQTNLVLQTKLQKRKGVAEMEDIQDTRTQDSYENEEVKNKHNY
jgi:hypothetical protein